MKFFNLLIISTLSTLFLISCDTKRNPYFGDDDAQFSISSVDGKAEASLLSSDKDITETKITFTACLKTLSGEGLPNGLLFEIQAGEEKLSSKTNIDGCLVWEERHRYESKAHQFNLRLNRTFLSKNDYNGKRKVSIYWDLKENSFSDNLKKNDNVPVRTEDPVQDGFSIPDATDTVQQAANDKAPSNNEPFNTPAPTENEIDLDKADRATLKTRLVLTSIALNRVKLKQDAPYKVDQNLTLYTQHTYRVSADPKYYVNMIKNPDTAVSPPGGKYKITLVFMDDPKIDLDKLAEELKGHNSLASIEKSQTDESRRIQLATQVLVSEKAITEVNPLTDFERRKILTKVMIPLVHSTVEFIADKKAEQNIEKYIDLSIKKLASLDVRSIVAVTVENVSQGQKQRLKGHGVGYVGNLLEPGTVTLLQSPVEADFLLSEYKRLVTSVEKYRPYDLFVAREKDLAVMNKADLANDTFPQSYFQKAYPFAEETENFLDMKLDKYRKSLYERSLCHKLFLNEELKTLDSKTKHGDEARLVWAFNCHSNVESYLDVSVIDFVDNVDGAVVKKVGRSIPEEISISRNFEKSLAEGVTTGTKRDFGAGKESGTTLAALLDIFVPGLLGKAADKVVHTASKLFFKILANENIEKEAIQQVVRTSLSSMKMNIGGNWFSATSKESAEGKSGTIARTSSEKMSINTDTYKISINTKRCAIVNYKPWVVQHLAQKNQLNIRSGFVVCSDKIKKPTYTERYYVVNQACSEKNGTTDCASQEENTLRMILRGEVMYNMFNKIVESTELEILLNPVASDALEQKRMHWVNLMDGLQTTQIFPGVLLPPAK